MALAPGATRILRVAEAGLGVPADAYWATVVLKYQGRRADLVPVATSFDESGRYGLQTPFAEGVSHLWKGSMWHVDGTHNSLVTAGNGGTGPTHAAITLFYNKGKSSYTIEKQLEPGQQIWANLGNIIRGQIPDKNGKTIPADVTMGSYELRDLDHIGVGYLYEGKLVIDKTWGHGYYGCAGCCGYETAQLTPNPMGGGVSTESGDTADAHDMCNNTWPDVTSEVYDWASTNTGIVNVASAVSHFMSPGTVTGSGQVQLQLQLAREECPDGTFEPQNTQNALQVAVTSANIVQNNITVALSGPSSVSGNLVVQVTGANGGSPIDPIENGTLGPGTYSYNFGLGSIPIGEYTTVTARWTVNGATVSASLGYTFEVMGTYVQTQYNTPYEGNCGGTATNVTLWKASPTCTPSSGSLLSNFINVVAAPGSGTGSGQSINYQGVVPEQYCTAYSTTNFREYATITGTLGSLSNSSVAACSQSPLYRAGAQVFIVGEGTKTVTDSCPACCQNTGYAHLDNYTTNNACSGIGSLPNALTIWLNP